jgi:hypothetical protein
MWKNVYMIKTNNILMEFIGPVKFYKSEAGACRINIAKEFSGLLEWENKDRLYAWYDKEKKELYIKETP